MAPAPAPDAHYRRSEFGHPGAARTVDELIYDEGKWTWSGERIRTTSEFSEEGKVQRSLHEQSEDGIEWRLAMDVTLRKID